MMKTTAKRVRELLNYEPDTGIFTWRVARGGGIKSGDVAGNIDTCGYAQIRIDGRRYSAHRVAYLYMTGEWPVEEIDHKDRNQANNCWSNLRSATRSNNVANRGCLITNKSRFKGASWDKKTQKWRATIVANGKWRLLGYFATAIEAHEAYAAKAKELFGEFARAA